ncbi:MAG: hypothetical protein J6Y02_17255 [Pseudobutyrivibrio sp.]|nr:hypothetical protein [Pseudobutyrivibrio sp.]
MKEKLDTWLDHAFAVVEERTDKCSIKEYFVMLGLIADMIYDKTMRRTSVENTIFNCGLTEENAACMFELWEQLDIISEEGS